MASQGFTKATTAALFLVLCICLDKRINGSVSNPARTAAAATAAAAAARQPRRHHKGRGEDARARVTN